MSKPVEPSWSDESGKKWVRMQARTDAQLAPLGRLALEALELRAGERVLDVGCGAGATLAQLAERVGPAGSVVGLDISEPLLTRAREYVREAGLENVEFVLGDAAARRFEQPFDALFSRFGVMFFEDPPAAFRNLSRSLKPGARLGFVCWQSLAENPWASLSLEAVRALAPDQPLPELLAPGRPGPFAFSDPALVRSILEQAGFSEVRIQPHESNMHIGGCMTLAEVVEFCLEIGPSARFAAEADPALVPRFRAVLAAALAPFVSARGVWMPGRSFVVTARSV